MQDEPVRSFKHHAHCYTAVFRPDPPDIPVSEAGTNTLRKLADHLGQLEGFEELGRDERFYQVEVHLRRSD